MEESLKARLIGAAVLVALAVLLIPELLSGRKAVEPLSEEGTGSRGTRTFTIELGQAQGPTTRSPTTSTAASSAPAAVASSEASAVAKPAVEAPVGPSVEPADATTAPARIAAAAPTTAKVVREPGAAPPTVETPPAATPAEPKPPPASTAAGGWAVQVGAFGSAETARKLVRDLGGAGYGAFVAPVNRGGKTLYRVRVGPTADKAGAEQLAQRLKARGLPATVVRND
jgi:DedD protein